jgi:hypothetical protein
MLTSTNSVNCRLPQTPRSPHAAATHYFDDIWSTKKKGGPRPLRRSSTTRNIGNLRRASTFGAETVEDDDADAESAFSFRRISSVGYLDKDAIEKKKEIDQHVANYVSDQLERMKTNDSATANAVEDEIGAQINGADESEFEVESRTPPDQQSRD